MNSERLRIKLFDGRAPDKRILPRYYSRWERGEGGVFQISSCLGDACINLRGICSTASYYQSITKQSEITFSKLRIRARTWLPLKVSVPVLSETELRLGNTGAVTEERTD